MKSTSLLPRIIAERNEAMTALKSTAVQSNKSKTTQQEETMTQISATQRGKEQAAGKDAIRPFQVMSVPEAELTELRRRINATRWPERETVADATQGVQLATTQALARYWATDYDWRNHRLMRAAAPALLLAVFATYSAWSFLQASNQTPSDFVAKRRSVQRMWLSLPLFCHFSASRWTSNEA
jgi:hypothetical protein